MRRREARCERALTYARFPGKKRDASFAIGCAGESRDQCRKRLFSFDEFHGSNEWRRADRVAHILRPCEPARQAKRSLIDPSECDTFRIERFEVSFIEQNE